MRRVSSCYRQRDMRGRLAFLLICWLSCAGVSAGSEPRSATGAYHGTIGKLEVFVRLEESAGGALAGRYFYASKGMDIRLEGRRQDSDVALMERVGGKQTGAFAGRIDGGNIAGTWSSGARKLPFLIAPVPQQPLQ